MIAMKIKKLICAVLALAAVAVLAGCGAGNKSLLKSISKTLSIDCSGAEVISQYDSHGGFHGDGTSFYALRFRDGSAAKEIAGSAEWREFPLSDSAVSIIWGSQTEEGNDPPLLIRDNDWNHPLFPRVEHGYWFFLDRHSFATDPKDDSQVLDESRPSYNFTVAVYDTDSNILYYSELDT